MLRPTSLSAIVILAFGTLSGASDPTADGVRDAVAARKLRDTDMKGSGAGATPYREVATDGGVLVGLEIALGGSPPIERVIAVRPIYRLAGHERTGAPAGRFLSEDVTRTARLIARDGYSVCGLTLSGGRRLDGLAVRFARTEATGLNLADAYESDWVGSMKADQRDPLDGQGQVVVGLFGRIEGDAVIGLGMTLVDLPRPASPTATPITTQAGAASSPEKTTDAVSDPNGSGALPFIVFGAVALPIGLVSLLAFRRKHEKIQVLPRISGLDLPQESPQAIVFDPPSIPSEILGTEEFLQPHIPTSDLLVESDVECLMR